MAKRKPKTLAKLKDEAATLLQRLRRMQEADDNGHVSCVTCGVTRHFADRMQGGHFIGRTHMKWKLDPRNIWPQCAKCNGFLHGNPIPYTIFMIRTFGQDFVDHMIETKNLGEKVYRPDILDMIEDLKAQVKQEEERVL